MLGWMSLICIYHSWLDEPNLYIPFMKALETLAPVFFMLLLGFIARVKHWITPEQKEGANKIVFSILFPVLIFSLIANVSFETRHIWIILYVFVCFMLALIIGKLVTTFTGKKYGKFSPHMITVVEGGNVALPLYLSIVGSSSNTVIFDIAGTITAFVVFPVLIARETAENASAGDIMKKIFTNSFVIAVIAGLFLNLTGLWGTLLSSSFGPSVTAVFDMATKGIVPMILFILGYELTVDQKMLGSIMKLALVKTVLAVLIILGFFVLFPSLMKDPVFMIAPIIYFFSPTGFGLIPIINPVMETSEEKEFASAFVSLYMSITLIVYTITVLFIA